MTAPAGSLLIVTPAIPSNALNARPANVNDIAKVRMGASGFRRRYETVGCNCPPAIFTFKLRQDDPLTYVKPVADTGKRTMPQAREGRVRPRCGVGMANEAADGIARTRGVLPNCPRPKLSKGFKERLTDRAKPYLCPRSIEPKSLECRRRVCWGKASTAAVLPFAAFRTPDHSRYLSPPLSSGAWCLRRWVGWWGGLRK